MKLFKVEFPAILVAVYSNEDLQEEIYSSISDSEYYTDFSYFDSSEITDVEELEDFNKEYIPYGQSSDMTAEDIVKLQKVFDKLTKEEVQLLEQTFQK